MEDRTKSATPTAEPRVASTVSLFLRMKLSKVFLTSTEPVTEDPDTDVPGIDGDSISQGSKRYLRNERDSLKSDASELNEVVRQFPFTEEEAFATASRAASSTSKDLPADRQQRRPVS